MGPLKENPTGYGGFHTLWAFLSHSKLVNDEDDEDEDEDEDDEADEDDAAADDNPTAREPEGPRTAGEGEGGQSRKRKSVQGRDRRESSSSRTGDEPERYSGHSTLKRIEFDEPLRAVSMVLSELVSVTQRYNT